MTTQSGAVVSSSDNSCFSTVGVSGSQSSVSRPVSPSVRQSIRPSVGPSVRPSVRQSPFVS